MNSKLMFLIGAALAVAAPARADFFDITYSSGDGLSANGVVDATANGDGSFTATSGYFNITSSGSGIPTGDYLLLPNPLGTTTYVPPIYPLAYFDDQLFPGTSAVLDGNGLDFYSSTQGINDLLTLYGAPNAGLLYFSPTNPELYDSGPVTVVAAPEPSQVISGLAFVGVGWVSLLARRLRQGK